MTWPTDTCQTDDHVRPHSTAWCHSIGLLHCDHMCIDPSQSDAARPYMPHVSSTYTSTHTSTLQHTPSHTVGNYTLETSNTLGICVVDPLRPYDAFAPPSASPAPASDSPPGWLWVAIFVPLGVLLVSLSACGAAYCIIARRRAEDAGGDSKVGCCCVGLVCSCVGSVGWCTRQRIMAHGALQRASMSGCSMTHASMAYACLLPLLACVCANNKPSPLLFFYFFAQGSARGAPLQDKSGSGAIAPEGDQPLDVWRSR